MYCNNCGKRINKGERFCGVCGTPTESFQNLEHVSRISTKNIITIAVCTVLSFFAIAAGGYYFLSNGESPFVEKVNNLAAKPNTESNAKKEEVKEEKKEETQVIKEKVPVIQKERVYIIQRENVNSGVDSYTYDYVDDNEIDYIYDSGLSIVSANASSYKVENGKKEDRYYYPDNVLDGDYNTAWVEAADGLGEGEWINFELEGEQEVSGVNIENGYKKFIDGKSDDYLYYCNSRAKTIRIEFSDGTYEDFELTDDFYAINQIMFSYPRVTNYIKITILDAYAGSKYEDTCISEISLF